MPTSERGYTEEASVPAAVELVRSGESHTLTLGDRDYRVGGLDKNNSLEVLKVSLRLISRGGALPPRQLRPVPRRRTPPLHRTRRRGNRPRKGTHQARPRQAAACPRGARRKRGLRRVRTRRADRGRPRRPTSAPRRSRSSSRRT